MKSAMMKKGVSMKKNLTKTANASDRFMVEQQEEKSMPPWAAWIQ